MFCVCPLFSPVIDIAARQFGRHTPHEVGTVLTMLFTLVVTSPAYAATQPSEPPPTDNGRWVGVISFFVIVGVFGFLIFLAKTYSKNNSNQQ